MNKIKKESEEMKKYHSGSSCSCCSLYPNPSTPLYDRYVLPDVAVLTAHCRVLSSWLNVHVVQSRLPDDVVSPSKLQALVHLTQEQEKKKTVKSRYTDSGSVSVPDFRGSTESDQRGSAGQWSSVKNTV